MRCYVTGEECTCGGFDVAADCPHDEMVHDPEEIEGVMDLEDDYASHYAIERRFSEMEEQLGG
jgi:hypothetical protein